MITPAEFERMMKELARSNDPEYSHGEADDLMCEVLEQLGYGAGVKVFDNMVRWYS